MSRNPLVRGVIAAVILTGYWGIVRMANRPGGFVAPPLSREQSLAVESDELFRKREYAAALPMLEKLRVDFPDNHIYLGRLAVIYRANGENAKEAEVLEKYMQVAPNPGEACPHIGDAYRHLGRKADALAAYERCAASGDSDAVFYLGRAWEREANWDKAAEVYGRGVEKSPGYVDMRLGLARVELRRGNVAAAKVQTDAALQKSPDSADGLLLAGLIARRRGEMVAARSYFDHGARVSPRYTELFRELARSSEHAHDSAGALRAWRHVLELVPNDAEATSAVTRLQGARG